MTTKSLVVMVTLTMLSISFTAFAAPTNEQDLYKAGRCEQNGSTYKCTSATVLEDGYLACYVEYDDDEADLQPDDNSTIHNTTCV